MFVVEYVEVQKQRESEKITKMSVYFSLCIYANKNKLKNYVVNSFSISLEHFI